MYPHIFLQKGSFLVLKPLADRVVVKPIRRREDEEASFFPIPLKTSRKRADHRRWYRQSLDNRTKLPLEVKVGDKVVYSKYSGSEIKIDGEEYLIIRESDILAVKE